VEFSLVVCHMCLFKSQHRLRPKIIDILLLSKSRKLLSPTSPENATREVDREPSTTDLVVPADPQDARWPPQFDSPSADRIFDHRH
jgi:hypothetical protein